MTAWGQARYDAAKPGIGPRAQPLGNDPMMGCDPIGYPRIAFYNAYPMEFVQTKDRLIEFFDFFYTHRTIYLDGRKLPDDPEPTWYGYSVGYWEANVLIVDTIGFNDQSWFDRAGDFHSDMLHVVERYTPVSPNVLNYEATIEDPQVFSRPWKISMPLYKHLEKNAQLLEFKCVEFVEELLYGHLRKQPSK